MGASVEFYEGSAPYYDLIYSPIVDYEREADLLEGVFAQYAGRPVRRILDMGSGTGNHALILASHGYDVVGVDRNEAFVAAAKEKARKRKDGPRFVVGDMRELEVEGRFDALISMFGAFGHLPREKAAVALLRFHELLEPGGVLAFEWWNEPGARDGYQDWLDREEEGIRLIRLSKSSVDAKDHTLLIAFKYLVLRGDHLEEAFNEEGTMALYRATEMEDLISQAGLTPAAMLDWARKALKPHRPEDFRVLAVARRER